MMTLVLISQNLPCYIGLRMGQPSKICVPHNAMRTGLIERKMRFYTRHGVYILVIPATMEAEMISVTVQYPVRQCWVVAKPCRSAFNGVCCVSLRHWATVTISQLEPQGHAATHGLRQNDMGLLHLSSGLTVDICPQVSCARCSWRSQDLPWWSPLKPYLSPVLSLVIPSAVIIGGLDPPAHREGCIYRDGDTKYMPSPLSIVTMTSDISKNHFSLHPRFVTT
jgi:hypothetical protein